MQAQAVLVTQFDEFEKAPLLLSQMADLLGTGVFNADGTCCIDW